MVVVGFIAAILIGLSLGLIGGGGSILTVPVLVYIFGVDPVLATSYSLLIVGATSLVGAVSNFKKKQVSISTTLLFGFSSITTVFLTRKYLIPIIPENLFSIGNVVVTHGMLTMLLFASLMVPASLSMIKNKIVIEEPEETVPGKFQMGKLLSLGMLIGIVTGFLGAGGGFLLIPTLVIIVGLPMKKAIGTSLLIIALNSLLGFAGDLGHFDVDWKFLLEILIMAIVGIFIGNALNKKIKAENLKKGFGWFVLIMGIYIIAKELFL